MTDEEATEPEVDHLQVIQQAIAAIDPTAMLVGFTIVSEWLENDGEAGVAMIATPMTPWHHRGLLEYALDQFTTPTYLAFAPDGGEFEEEDEEL